MCDWVLEGIVCFHVVFLFLVSSSSSSFFWCHLPLLFLDAVGEEKNAVTSGFVLLVGCGWCRPLLLLSPPYAAMSVILVVLACVLEVVQVCLYVVVFSGLSEVRKSCLELPVLSLWPASQGEVRMGMAPHWETVGSVSYGDLFIFSIVFVWRRDTPGGSPSELRGV